MPLKWNLYKSLLIIYMVIVILLMVATIIAQAGNKPRGAELWGLIIGILMLLSLFFNGFLNFLWIQVYYPDQMPSKKIIRSTKIFHWVSIPILLLLAFVGISSIISFFVARLSLYGRNLYYVGANGALVLTGLIGIATFIFQMQLFKLIRRNSQSAFDGFME